MTYATHQEMVDMTKAQLNDYYGSIREEGGLTPLTLKKIKKDGLIELVQLQIELNGSQEQECLAQVAETAKLDQYLTDQKNADMEAMVNGFEELVNKPIEKTAEIVPIQTESSVTEQFVELLHSSEFLGDFFDEAKVKGSYFGVNAPKRGFRFWLKLGRNAHIEFGTETQKSLFDELFPEVDFLSWIESDPRWHRTPKRVSGKSYHYVSVDIDGMTNEDIAKITQVFIVGCLDLLEARRQADMQEVLAA